MKGDFLVDALNPTTLDATLQQMGAVLLGGPDDFVRHEGYYVVRSIGNAGFVRYAIQRQGYARIIGDAPDPAPWDVPSDSPRAVPDAQEPG